MEACQAVEKEHHRVTQKLQGAFEATSNRLQTLLNVATSLKESLIEKENTPLSEEDIEVMKDYIKQVSTEIQAVSQDHKDVHASISKYGRVIDKYFVKDNACMAATNMVTMETKQLLNRAICEHLLREGRMDVAEVLMAEVGLSHQEGFVTMFTEIHQIVQELRNKNVEPALQWALGHRAELLQNNSTLEFKLRQRKYLNLLSEGKINEAISYAKIFGEFSSYHSKDIQRLMGCLLYVHKGLITSPYCDLFDPWHWSDLIDTFTRDACCLLGLSVESPLAIAVIIGSSALPQLLHLQSVMVQRQVVDVLTGRDELPCEIQLPWKHRYHSIFTCPILRQQASETNPPVRLSCGHAISRDAMKKLVSHSGRLKCPYCPIEMSTKDIQVLKF